jgi:hypothetical protein
MVASIVGQAYAGFMTFTDRSAWISALGRSPNLQVDFHDFNQNVSFATSPLLINGWNRDIFGSPPLEFPIFTLAVQGGPTPPSGNIIDVAPDAGFSTPHAVLYGDSNTSPSMAFFSPLVAFGANFKVLQGQSQFVLRSPSGGISAVIPGPGSDGFYGFLVTPDLAFVAWNKQSLTPSFLLAMDDAEAASAVPEPASLMHILLGSLTVAGYGCRRWLRRSDR